MQELNVKGFQTIIIFCPDKLIDIEDKTSNFETSKSFIQNSRKLYVWLNVMNIKSLGNKIIYVTGWSDFTGGT